MPSIGFPELLILLLVALVTAYPLWGIIDAIRQPTEAWHEAGQWRWLWILVQILLNAVGTTFYLLVIRRSLRAVQT